MSIYEDKGRLEEQLREARVRWFLSRAGFVALGFLGGWFLFGRDSK